MDGYYGLIEQSLYIEKSIFRRDWDEKGILFVKDVMDSDGCLQGLVRKIDYNLYSEGV